jgi:hypothetical protein
MSAPYFETDALLTIEPRQDDETTLDAVAVRMNRDPNRARAARESQTNAERVAELETQLDNAVALACTLGRMQQDTQREVEVQRDAWRSLHGDEKARADALVIRLAELRADALLALDAINKGDLFSGSLLAHGLLAKLTAEPRGVGVSPPASEDIALKAASEALESMSAGANDDGRGAA